MAQRLLSACPYRVCSTASRPGLRPVARFSSHSQTPAECAAPEKLMLRPIACVSTPPVLPRSSAACAVLNAAQASRSCWLLLSAPAHCHCSMCRPALARLHSRPPHCPPPPPPPPLQDAWLSSTSAGLLSPVIFMTLASSGWSPRSRIPLLIEFSSGCSCSLALAGPATAKVTRCSIAASGRPNTGADTKFTPAQRGPGWRHCEQLGCQATVMLWRSQVETQQAPLHATAHHISAGSTNALCKPQTSLPSRRSMQRPTAATSHPLGRLHQRAAHSPAGRWAGCISPPSCALAARSCRAGGFCEAVVLAGQGRHCSAVQAGAQRQAMTWSAVSGQVATTLHRALLGPALQQEQSSLGKSSRMHASRPAESLPAHTQQRAGLPCPSLQRHVCGGQSLPARSMTKGTP